MTADELRELAQSAIDNRAFGWEETAHRLHDAVSTASAELESRDREIAELERKADALADAIELTEKCIGYFELSHIARTALEKALAYYRNKT